MRSKLKLAVNLLTYVNWASISESYRLAEASGLDQVFVEAVSRTPVPDAAALRSELRDAAGSRRVGRIPGPSTPVYTAEKDLRTPSSSGERAGWRSPPPAWSHRRWRGSTG